MDITNDAMLTSVLNTIAENVITIVSIKVLALLQKNIMALVYELGGPNHYYYNGSGVPTYQFLHAFKWDELQNSITKVTKTLFYDWASMEFNSALFLHGDPARGDQRQQLAEALDVEGWDNGILGGKQRGAYFKNTMDDLLGGTLNDWFREEFRNYGIIKT